MLPESHLELRPLPPSRRNAEGAFQNSQKAEACFFSIRKLYLSESNMKTQPLSITQLSFAWMSDGIDPVPSPPNEPLKPPTPPENPIPTEPPTPIQPQTPIENPPQEIPPPPVPPVNPPMPSPNPPPSPQPNM